MSTAETEIDTPKGGSRMPLVIGLAMALLCGGAAFYAVYSGLVGLPGSTPPSEAAKPAPRALPDVAFVPLDPLIVNLGAASGNRHLRFRAQLEVAAGYEADVAKLTPRVMDVLNGYLRAVDITDLEDPAALVRLRAQMLRRIQIVTGEGRVRDLLLMEFVLN